MTDIENARGRPRRRVLKAGLIACHNRFVTFNCTVRDLTDAGARVVVDDQTGIPSHFELILDLDGLEAQCEVAWRKNKEIGVRFVQPPTPIPKKRAQVVNAVRPEGAGHRSLRIKR